MSRRRLYSDNPSKLGDEIIMKGTAAVELMPKVFEEIPERCVCLADGVALTSIVVPPGAGESEGLASNDAEYH